MAQTPARITIRISPRYGFTKSELESLKNAFNLQLASIHRARKGEDDSPVGETNVPQAPSKKKTTKRSKKSAKKK